MSRGRKDTAARLLRRLQRLDRGVSGVLSLFERALSQQEHKHAVRHLREVLGSVDRALVRARARLSQDRLADLDGQHWLPTLEAVKTHLMRALDADATTRKGRLASARWRIGDAVSAVRALMPGEDNSQG